MANPKISTLIDIFLPDGYGAFGYGDGEYGGALELVNPQWNTNAGVFGVDPVTLIPYVEATSTPSYVGAALYDATYNSFFAKVTPAPNGLGTVQTALIIKFDIQNYVEISVGPNEVFNAYAVNNTAVVTTASAMPAYDPTAHAYWRLRNDDALYFHFDVSPDGSTWTELGSVPYTWDATAITVMFFAGFTGLEDAGNRASISRVNLPGTTLALSGSTGATAAANGVVEVSSPNSLSGRAHASAGLSASFSVVLGTPEGGLTDFSYSAASAVDPLMSTSWGVGFGNSLLALTNANPLVQGTWKTGAYPYTVPTTYRDGSYWPPAAYALVENAVTARTNNNPLLVTNAQVEQTTGISNRLNLNSYIYNSSCPYNPGNGVATVIRSTDVAYTGQYSGKIVSSGSAGTLGTGALGYWTRPALSSLVPIRRNASSVAEALFGSVLLSTQRAGTQWLASFVFYDANYNLVASTYSAATITNMNTHPGGGVWQPGSVSITSGIPSSAVYVGLIPAVVVPSGSLVETVYASNHTITGASLYFTETNTTYSNPRTAEINVKADRVNYALNPGFNSSALTSTYWTTFTLNTTGTPVPVTPSWSAIGGYQSGGTMLVSFVPPSGSFTGGSTSQLGVRTSTSLSGSGNLNIVQGLKVGHTYTVSVWVKPNGTCPDISMSFMDANFKGVSNISSNNTRSNFPDRVDGNWVRLQSTFTVGPQMGEDYHFLLYVKYPDYVNAGTFSFNVDSILVEESPTYNGYFDGGFASADYKWESGGTANACRSYYYKDYNNKFLRLNKSLSSVLPIGESYKLLFAQPVTTL